MAFKTCMNILCGTTSSNEWKIGWRLRSGELANLCVKCGSAFEQHVYCEEFHADDSGWRQCATCGKRLHCGCIASWSLIELLDGGGVKCIVCAKHSGPNSSTNGKCDVSGPYPLTENNFGAKYFSKFERNNGTHLPSILRNPEINATCGLLKQEESFLPFREVASTSVSNLPQSPMGLFQNARLDMSSLHMQAKDKNYETAAHPNLNITLGVPTGNLHHPVSNAFPQGLVSQQFLPRSNLGLPPASDTNMTTPPSLRVARPPIDGRGRHQLLPRYWPRITDQELQQISGDPNCTIVPLFEKVLSASDAGRIGRLVLPKACAEAYFPPISQAEGLPIKIQDVKGKEWVFQFRFWPNNNSRMYVLEGVTPCIQSMQLQAGDTVTFSRLDPEGKLVMGYRKASNSTSMQSIKGSTEPQTNANLSRQLDSSGGNVKWLGGEKYGEPTEEGMLPASTPMPEKKKGRNIGSKNKRLLIDSQDALALKLTWEEVQGMLRPPQSARPSIFVVEDYEFEEYEEPPVFGKSTIFTARPSGIIEQWAQCDSCSKWRRLPADVLLPPKWTCTENVWDQSRCFCSAPNELSPRELENFQLSKDTKKRRMAMASKMLQDQVSSGLDALANAATLGDNNPSSSSVGATTKHPRHRPGCSCIVCIQPPSGKGKHKSTCTCTVCMTVKRRFKTLMMRKKKRQSDQEAAQQLALRNNHPQTRNKSSEDEKPEEQPENITGGTRKSVDGPSRVGPNPDDMLLESGKGLDLNSHPEREEELLRVHGPSEMGQLRSLLQFSSLPLEAYVKPSENVPIVLEAVQRGGSELNRGEVVGEIGEQLVEDHAGGQSMGGQANLGDGRSSGSDRSDPL